MAEEQLPKGAVGFFRVLQADPKQVGQTSDESQAAGHGASGSQSTQGCCTRSNIPVKMRQIMATPFPRERGETTASPEILQRTLGGFHSNDGVEGHS